MADYRGMYHSLFHDVTSAIALLQKAQRKTEDIYIASEDIPLKLGNRNGAESEEETDSE